MGATTIVLTLFLAVVAASFEFAVCGGSRRTPPLWTHGRRNSLVAGTIPVTFFVSDDIPREGPIDVKVHCPPQFNNIDVLDHGTVVTYLGNTALTPGMACTAVLYYLKAEFGIHWSDVPSNAAAVHWRLSMGGVYLSFDNVSWQKVSSWVGQ